MAHKEEWFNDESFWEEYAPIMFDARHWAEVPRVADGVTRLCRFDLYTAGIDTAPKLLDLCCGFGRLTLEFAARGFTCTGVDITKSYLQTAAEDAAAENLEIEYIQTDIRDFVRPDYFDAAVNLYISFGYFADPEGDKRVVKNIYQSLKSGGVFIIETLGKEIAVRDFVKSEWFERAGYFVLTEYEALDAWGLLKNRWILFKEGRYLERNFTQRLYAATELRALLLEAGFADVEMYGNWDEGPYDERAEQLIVVGRKA